MPLAVILCPWVVMPTAFVPQGLAPQLLHQLNFEFESSATAEDTHAAEIMKQRLALASGPLTTYQFSVRLPTRSDPLVPNLWDRVVSESVGGGAGQPMMGMPSQLLGQDSPDIILTLLTQGSTSTLIESTAFALAGLAPQVCVGIDIPVPNMLSAFWRVTSVEPSADESLFLQVVETACRQHLQGQTTGVPAPAF
jgi:hypothetical protein